MGCGGGKMKKLIAIIGVIALLFLCGCGGETEQEAKEIWVDRAELPLEFTVGEHEAKITNIYIAEESKDTGFETWVYVILELPEGLTRQEMKFAVADDLYMGVYLLGQDDSSAEGSCTPNRGFYFYENKVLLDSLIQVNGRKSLQSSGCIDIFASVEEPEEVDYSWWDIKVDEAMLKSEYEIMNMEDWEYFEIW